MTATGSQPSQEFRLSCAFSESLPALLTQLRLSVLLSTYHTGHLAVVGTRHGRLVLTFHQFERATTGIAVKPGVIAVCAGTQVWLLPNAPDIAAKFQPEPPDACFLARTTHFTDDIEGHECAWVGGEFWIVNTLFSCLAALYPPYNFVPRWRPPFISALRPEDRCHLNGLAVAGGQPRYVTALAETDTPAGWRAVKHNGGCLIEVPSGRLLVRGLALPHSPRVEGDRVFFLHSGQGELAVADPQTGQVAVVAALPGMVRGLSLYRGFAFVGLSKARPALEGVPIVAQRDQLRCGLWVVDLRTGAVAANLEFDAGVDEIFDVQVLPGILRPFVFGPCAEKDTGQTLWAVPS